MMSVRNLRDVLMTKTPCCGRRTEMFAIVPGTREVLAVRTNDSAGLSLESGVGGKTPHAARRHQHELVDKHAPRV